jgi:hypothetical protein
MTGIALSKSASKSRLLPIALLLGIVALPYGQGRGQVPQTAGSSGKQSMPLASDRGTPGVIGSRYCSNCHSHPENAPDRESICRMVEFPIWKSRDRHKIAFDVLLSLRSQEIGQRLGIDVTDRQGACISCHGTVVPKGVEPFQFEARDDGVTCVVCHGAREEWVKEHSLPRSPRWRGLTRAQKQELMGMRDLWSPKSRAETCLACHIGNVDQGKILTHAMYAAGHPPLPSVEVAYFSEQEPRHWQYLRQKPDSIHQQLGFNLRRLEQAELVAVSGLAALTASLEMLAPSTLNTAPGMEQVDFARYDCSACHHELSVTGRSWRQMRGNQGAVGRPTTPRWPLALVRLGLEAADPARADSWYRDLQTKLQDIDDAMTERPFGNLAKIRSIASEIVAWANEPLGVLEQMARAKPGEHQQVVDRARALRMLKTLGTMATESIPDYDSARQMAWAFRTIYYEIEHNPEKRDSAINSILDRLDGKLQLNLNADLKAGRKPIVDSLAGRLRAVAEYDPVEFQQDMSKLVKLSTAH